MRGARLAALAPLLLAGCAAAPGVERDLSVAVDARGLWVAEEGGTPRLVEAPSREWTVSKVRGDAVAHAGASFQLREEHDNASGGGVDVLWELSPEERPLARLEGARAQGLVETGGRLYVWGSRLWVLDDATLRLRELSLPLAVRLGRAGRALRGRCGACGGGCLEVLGQLFTRSGPDPGWTTLLDTVDRLP